MAGNMIGNGHITESATENEPPGLESLGKGERVG